MSEGIGRRILRETARFAALQVVGAGLVWASNLALTRLLDARAFGVYAIGSFFLGLGTILGDGGLGATLLRKREGITEEELRAALTFLLSLGAVMAAALLLASPWIGLRYHLTARETDAMRVMALVFVISPLRAVPYIRLERALEFSRIARIELSATMVRQAAAVAFSVLHGGVWALVIANLLAALTQLALAYRASPGWAGLGTRWATLRPLLAYGVRVQSLSLAAFFKDNVSAVLLGAALSPTAVGVFDFGLKYAQIPVLAVNALGRVQLPVYARLEARDPELFDALTGATRTALVPGLAMLLAMTFAAPALIPVVYAPRWITSVPVIYGIALNMAGGLVAGPLFVLLQGQGEASRAVRVFTVWTIATWVLAAATFRFGLGWIALTQSLTTLAVVAYLARWASGHLGRSLAAEWRGPVFSSVVAAGLTLALSQSPVARPIRGPVGLALFSLSIYGVFLAMFEGRRVGGEVRSLIQSVRGGGADRKESPAASVG